MSKMLRSMKPAVFKTTRSRYYVKVVPRSYTTLRRALLLCPPHMLFLLPLLRPCLPRYAAMASRRARRSSSASHASAWTLRTRPSPACSSPAILVTSQTALHTVIAVRLRGGLPRPLRTIRGDEECTGA